MNNQISPSFEQMRTRVQGILNYTPFYEDFNPEVIEFLQTYFLWRHPYKFLFNDEEICLTAGRVKAHMGRRFFQLKFNNGYIWLHELTE